MEFSVAEENKQGEKDGRWSCRGNWGPFQIGLARPLSEVSLTLRWDEMPSEGCEPRNDETCFN